MPYATLLLNGELLLIGPTGGRFRIDLGNKNEPAPPPIVVFHAVLRSSCPYSRVALSVPAVGFTLASGLGTPFRHSNNSHHAAASAPPCASSGTFAVVTCATVVSCSLEIVVEWSASPTTTAEEHILLDQLPTSTQKKKSLSTTDNDDDGGFETTMVVMMKKQAKKTDKEEERDDDGKTSPAAQSHKSPSCCKQIVVNSSSIQIDLPLPSQRGEEDEIVKLYAAIRALGNWSAGAAATCGGDSPSLSTFVSSCHNRSWSSAAVSCLIRLRGNNKMAVTNKQVVAAPCSSLRSLFEAAAQSQPSWRCSSVTFSTIIRFIQRGAGKDRFKWGEREKR